MIKLKDLGFRLRSIGYDLVFIPAQDSRGKFYKNKEDKGIAKLLREIKKGVGIKNSSDEAPISERQMQAVYALVLQDREEPTINNIENDLYQFGYNPNDKRCCINRKRY